MLGVNVLGARGSRGGGRDGRAEQVLYFGEELARVLIALAGLAVDAAHDHVFERLGNIAVDLARRRREVVHVRVHRGDDIVAVVAERKRTGEDLVHHDADRIQVAANVGGFAQETLGREVRNRTDDLPGTRRLRHVAGAPRQAEVGELHVLTAFENHDVGWLDVAMNHALAVGVFERFEHFGDVSERLLIAEFAALERRERLAGHELHDDVREPLPFAGVVDRDDALMIEARHRSRFGEKARVGVVRAVDQHLDRDVAAQRVIRCSVRVGSAPAADEFDDLVPPGQRPSLEGVHYVIFSSP